MKRVGTNCVQILHLLLRPQFHFVQHNMKKLSLKLCEGKHVRTLSLTALTEETERKKKITCTGRTVEGSGAHVSLR